jgi:hypothetical protein
MPVPSSALGWTWLSAEADEILPVFEFICSKLIEPDQRRAARNIEFQVSQKQQPPESLNINARRLGGFRCLIGQEPIELMTVFFRTGAVWSAIMATRSRKTASSRPKTASRKAGSVRRKSGAKRKASPKRWSQRVTQESDALDLKHGVFTLRDPKRIAASLKRSAERSSRRKAGAYRSALSMLTFYVNRAGKTLPKTQRERLERAKVELKRQFGRE